MNEQDIRETMEQIRLPEEVKEEMTMRIQERLESKAGKAKKRGKRAAAVAVAALAVCILGIPAQAMVRSLVEARMERIPKEEIQAVSDMVQSQDAEADTFSRPYSEKERARMRELRQAYENGTFPEREIVQMENAKEAAAGTLCYDQTTGMFYLPDRQLTDEELLEIIDFQTRTDYALTQNDAAKEAREAFAQEQAQLAEQVEAVGGISEEEAVKIAESRMKAELGAEAEGKDDVDVLLVDTSETDRAYETDMIYVVSFENAGDRSTYTCEIDAANGSVLGAREHRP